MANTVAGLAVLLGLDATEYTRGLTKAEYQAQQFAKNTRSAILEVGKILGTLEIGRQVYEATKAIIAEAAALNDLADATGSTVESLSRLNNQVKISGGDIKSMNDAVLKLAAGMSGADSKGSKVNETLKLLGITAKDPVEALQQVALKLNTYADGVNKVGLAQALFGKSGREFLKSLQDMAELQDVQATVTAKQAQEAENLEKSWRRLSVESESFKNAILNDVVPALLTMIERFNDARKESNDLFETLKRWSQFSLFGKATDDLEYFNKEIDKLEAKVANPTFMGFKVGVSDQLLKELAEMKRAREQIIREQARNVGGFPSNAPPRTGQAPAPPGGGGDRTRALKEATDEGLRYQQSLEKQLQSTLQLSHAEEAEVAIFDAMRKGQAGFTEERKATIRDMAEQLDTTEALKKAEQERKRSQEQIEQATKNAIKSGEQETESIKQGNEQLREQIVFLKGGQEAVDRMTDAKLADAIATKEQTLAAYESSRANESLIAQTEEQIRQLRERQALISDKRAAEAAAEEAKKAKQYADELGQALAQGAENAILHYNNLRDVLKGVEQDLLRIITRQLVTKPLGGFLSDLIGAGISGLGGSSYGMGVRASGGPVAAGEPYMVGERGPELFIPKQSGSIVANNKMGGSFVFNINVPAGASRSTIDQTRVKFGLELQAALDRNS